MSSSPHSAETRSLDISIPTSSPKPPSSPRPIQRRDFPELENADEAHFALSPHAVPYVPLAERTLERPFSLPQYRNYGTLQTHRSFVECSVRTGSPWWPSDLSRVLMRTIPAPVGFVPSFSHPPPPYSLDPPPTYSEKPDRITWWETSYRLRGKGAGREVRDGVLGWRPENFVLAEGIVRSWDPVKGFGVVLVKERFEVYVHVSGLHGREELQIGEAVRIRCFQIRRHDIPYNLQATLIPGPHGFPPLLQQSW